MQVKVRLPLPASCCDPGHTWRSFSTQVALTWSEPRRLCVRFSPVEHVVQGSVSAMKALAKDILPAAFPPDTDGGQGTKVWPCLSRRCHLCACMPSIKHWVRRHSHPQFAVQYEHRASVKLDRKQVIDAFVEEIPCVRPNASPLALCAFD